MADTWDIYGNMEREYGDGGCVPHDPLAKDTANDPGSEFYHGVVHYPGLIPMHLIPYGVMKDENGQPVKGRYKTESGFAEAPIPMQEIATRKVTKWVTKKEYLDDMDSHMKSVINHLKASFAKGAFALWFHDGRCDQASMHGGPHFHVFLRSCEKQNGTFYNLHHMAWKRDLMKKLKDVTGSYVKFVAVAKPPNLWRYLMQAPRLFMGMNSPAFLPVMRDAVYVEAGQDPTSFFGRESWDMAGGNASTDADGTYDEWAETASQKRKADDVPDWETAAWNLAQGKPPPYKEARVDDGTFNFRLENNPKSVVTVTETQNNRLEHLVETLMRRWRVYDMTNMSIAANKEQIINYRNLWFRIQCRYGVKSSIPMIKQRLQAEYFVLSFKELLRRLPSTFDDKEYYPVDESLQYFKAWAEGQKFSLENLVNDVVDVIDRRRLKKNTILFLGPPNGGKTMMMSNPLKDICQFIGRIGQRNSGSQFIFQNVPLSRLVIVDEAKFGKEQFEDLKLLFGGEPLPCDQKNLAAVDSGRVPVLCTSNNEPWQADYSEEKAFRARMIVYRVQHDEELKQLKKNIHPGIWIKLYEEFLQEKIDEPIEPCLGDIDFGMPDDEGENPE